MILSLVLTATAGSRATDTILRAGPDHSFEVVDGRQVYRYDTAGRLIAVDTSPETPAPTALTADGGGNHAELSDTQLVVTGAHPCTLPVKGRREARMATLSTDGPWPTNAAEAPFALAVGADFATLAEKEAVLVVDLATCTAVAARSEEFKPWEAIAIVDGALATVVANSEGVVLRRWSLPALVPLDGFVTKTSAVLPGRAGPTLVTGDRPSRSHALVGATTRTLAGRVVVVGTNVFQLDHDGAVRWLDGDGRVRGTAPAGSLQDVETFDQGAEEWWLSDGSGVVHLPGGQQAPPVISRENDDPEGQDALAPTATGHLPDPILPSTRGDSSTLRQRPQGLIVMRGGRQWGVAVPAWTTNARVSPDGRVVVTQTGDQLEAWRVADGQRLWTRAMGTGTIAVGRDWLAVSGSQGWTFYDPKDGAPIAVLDTRMALRMGDTVVPFDPTKVRGAAWTAPAPKASRWHRELSTDGWLRGAATDCQTPATTLAAVSPWPELYNFQRTQLQRECSHAGSTTPPDWPATATATPGASWAWTAPDKVVSIQALDGGRLLVVGERAVGVLGADGALLWSTQDARRAVGVGDVVLVTTPDRVTARAARTGKVLWKRAGNLWADASKDGVRFRRTEVSPLVLIDPHTGATHALTELVRGSAWGWACPGGPCTQQVERVESATNERGGVDEVAVDGERTWRRTGSTIVASGVSAPATTASPRVERLPVEVRLPIPPPMPVPVRPVATEQPPSVMLVDGIDGAILTRDGKPAWTAEGRQRVGIVGEVAIVRDPIGAHEGRALVDGRVLWTKDLGAPSADTSHGVVMVGERDDWDLYDERNGERFGHVDTKVTAAARLGDRTLLATGPRAPQTIREVGGATLGTVDDTIQHIVSAGDRVILVSYEGRLTALREGKTVWRVGPIRFLTVRATPTTVLLEGVNATFVLDAATGLVRDVEVREN